MKNGDSASQAPPVCTEGGTLKDDKTRIPAFLVGTWLLWSLSACPVCYLRWRGSALLQAPQEKLVAQHWKEPGLLELPPFRRKGIESE